MLYAALYLRGPSWDASRTLGDQSGLDAHMAFLSELERRRLIERGGPFHPLSALVAEDLVGLVVLSADDEAAARRTLETDPALSSRVMECALHRWHV